EQHVDPLRRAPELGEEEGLLGGAQVPAAAGAALGTASIRLRAFAALCRSSCHSNPPLSYRASPSTRVAITRSGLPPKTTAAAGSSHGWYGDPSSETTVRSARLPGTSDPISRSRPSARAEPSVASASASAGLSASGERSRERATTSAVRSSSNASKDGADAGLSVPRPS